MNLPEERHHWYIGWYSGGRTQNGGIPYGIRGSPFGGDPDGGLHAENGCGSYLGGCCGGLHCDPNGPGCTKGDVCGGVSLGGPTEGPEPHPAEDAADVCGGVCHGGPRTDAAGDAE